MWSGNYGRIVCSRIKFEQNTRMNFRDVNEEDSFADKIKKMNEKAFESRELSGDKHIRNSKFQMLFGIFILKYRKVVLRCLAECGLHVLQILLQ